MVVQPELDPQPAASTTPGDSDSAETRMWKEVSLDSGEIAVLPPNPVPATDVTE